MRFFLLLIGSVLSIAFIVLLCAGKKYSYVFENLSESDYPLHELYVAGWVLNSTKLLALKGKTMLRLKTQASLLYDAQYAEYYATVAWTQALTLAHLILAVTFLIAGVLYDVSVVMLLGGGFICLVCVVYSMDNMKNMLSKRTEECEKQFPEVVSTMAILVNSGMVLRNVWNMIAGNGKGALYDMMQDTANNMKNGYSDSDAIYLFGRMSNSVEIKKFTSALLQSMEKGGAELSDFLTKQSSEMWNMKRQRMLQMGEKAATKLLIPIVLIFVGIIIIVMTAAFAGSLF